MSIGGEGGHLMTLSTSLRIERDSRQVIVENFVRNDICMVREMNIRSCQASIDRCDDVSGLLEYTL